MKIIEKNKTLFLRKQGLSYNDILRKLPVAKATLSYWLRDIELNSSQSEDMASRIARNRDRFAEYSRARSRKINDEKRFLYGISKNEIAILNSRELKLVGIALYWAEGYKADSWKTVSFCNSDPSMVFLMMRWFREICKVEEDRFRLKVQVHEEKHLEKIKRFWSTVTGIPLSQFTKSTITISKSSKFKRGNTLPCGTLQIRVSDVKLFTKIRGWIKGLGAPWSSLA